MNLEDVARGVRNWAISNRMMGGMPSSPNFDLGLIREVFGATLVSGHHV